MAKYQPAKKMACGTKAERKKAASLMAKRRWGKNGRRKRKRKGKK